MQLSVRIFTLTALALFSAPSLAVFHLWQITEVYSSADGSVQFIELEGLADSQHLLDGHAMVANSDGTEVFMEFGSNLPSSSTSNRRMLLATPGFAQLPGGVAPDFEIPAGFFNPDASSITLDFAEGSDTFTFNGADLPGDGKLSLLRDSSTAINSPENFSGEVGELTPLPVFTDRFEVADCEDRGPGCFTMHFNASPEPTDEEIHSSPHIRAVDVYLLADRSGSMSDEVSNVISNLSSVHAELVCPPEGSGTPGQCIEDLWWGSGTIGFSGADGEPYGHHSDLQSNPTTAANAIVTTEPSGCCDEATRLAAFSAVSGEGSSATECSVDDPYSARSTCIGSPVGAEGFGYGCFRPESHPVIVVLTDEAPSNNLDCPSTSFTAGALVDESTFFAAVLGDSPDAQARPDLEALSQASGSLDSAGQPLVFDGGGAQAASALLTAIESAALDNRINASAQIIDDPSDGVDVVEAFIDRIETVQSGTFLCTDGLAETDTNGDGHADTFVSILQGTPVCFRLVLKNNTTIAAGAVPQVYRATLKTFAGRHALETRPLRFVVPAN